VSGKMQSRP